MNEFIEQIINFLEQYLSNKTYISNNVFQYDCIFCGKSKNNKPHMRINYNDGLYFCYRHQEGGILYNLIKQFKTDSNKEYINSLLKMYKNYYNHDYNNFSSSKIISTYNYTNFNIYEKNNKINKDSIAFNFFKYRLNAISLDKLLDIFNLNCYDNIISYNSYFMKYKYSYDIIDNLNYKKQKTVNNNICNDKIDYYFLLNSYNNNNLFISESLFDLITIYYTDVLYNNKTSNYLALCSKNYKKLFMFLLNTGKFYYENIYIMLDNDINKEKFVYNIINILSNGKQIDKLKLYKNIYIIIPQNKYIDINDQYIKENYKLSNLFIKKII